jgi:hypothetical protein
LKQRRADSRRAARLFIFTILVTENNPCWFFAKNVEPEPSVRKFQTNVKENNLMKQIINGILLTSFVVLLGQNGAAQGFVNLDFEDANVSAYGAGSIPAINGIPGWSAYVNGSRVSQILYNTINLDEPAVTIQGTNSSSLTPIQGNFSVLLQGGSVYATGSSSAIGQTGQIPITAQSLTFWGGDNFVSFNGQPLSIVLLGIGSNPNYNIYGADISAFAGQTGQLLFTAPKLTGAIIDNIQFSSSAVPEPSEFALAALGALLLGFRRWRNSR